MGLNGDLDQRRFHYTGRGHNVGGASLPGSLDHSPTVVILLCAQSRPGIRSETVRQRGPCHPTERHHPPEGPIGLTAPGRTGCRPAASCALHHRRSRSAYNPSVSVWPCPQTMAARWHLSDRSVFRFSFLYPLCSSLAHFPRSLRSLRAEAAPCDPSSHRRSQQMKVHHEQMRLPTKPRNPRHSGKTRTNAEMQPAVHMRAIAQPDAQYLP